MSVKLSFTSLLNKSSIIGNKFSSFKWPGLLKCKQQPSLGTEGDPRCQGTLPGYSLNIKGIVQDFLPWLVFHHRLSTLLQG